MGKLKFTFSNIIYILALVASFLLLENIPFLSSNLRSGLNNTHFFMLFTFAMVGYFTYFFIQHLKNKVVLDYVQVVGFAIFFAFGLVSIWGFRNFHLESSVTGYTFDYSLSTWTQVRQTLSLFTFIVTLYATLFHFNRNFPSIRKLQIVYLGVIVFVYFAIIYSLITEINTYKYNLSSMSNFRAIKSIFWNSNMFSGMIVIGILSCIGFNYFKKNAFCYISIAGFFVIIVLVGSLNAIAVSGSVLIIYYLIEILAIVRKKFKTSMVLLALFLISISTLIVLFACALSYDLGGLTKFCKTLHLNITSADYATLTRRTFTWSSCLTHLANHPFSLCFGLGADNTNAIIGGYWHVYRKALFGTLSAHSGYIQILMNYGITGFSLYAGFILYFFICFFKLIKKQTRFSLLFGLVGIAMLAYGVLESFGPFLPNTQGILVGILFFMPLINRHKHLKRHQLGDEVAMLEKPKPLKPRSVMVGTAIILGGLLSAAGSLFVFPNFRALPLRDLLLNICIGLFILSCFLPFILSSLVVKGKRHTNLWFITINGIAFALLGALFTLFYVYSPNLIVPYQKWVLPGLLFVILLIDSIYIGIAKQRKFTTFLYNFIAFTKNVCMGVFGVFLVALGLYLLRGKMDLVSPLTFIIYVAFTLLIYFIFVNLIPFKENKIVINHFNDLGLYSLHKDVVKDRLGVINEARRD